MRIHSNLLMPSAASRSPRPPAEPAGDRVSLEEREPATPLLHKGVCAVVAGGLAWNVANIGMQVAALPGLEARLAAVAMSLGATAAGWVLSDLASGVVHWGLDNYPTHETPVLGRLADSFQNHHHDRTSILKGSTWTKFAEAGSVVSLPLLALAAANPHYAVTSLATTALAGMVLTQASHRWTHMAKPPRLARKLMDLGISQSKRNHAVHHAMPWDDYYCIVNGMWNPLLSRVDFWRKLERGVFRLTGREPHSWRDPGVKALALGQITRQEFLEGRAANRKVFREKVKDEPAGFLARRGRRP